MADKRVLVVEDDVSMRAVLAARINQQDGLEADTASSGSEALEQLAAKEYAVLVLDMMLPDMSGLDVLDRATTADPDRVPPVVAMTGASRGVISDELIRGSFTHLIQEIFRKPFDQKELVALVRSLAQ